MRWQAQYFTDHAQRVKAILSEREVNAAALMSGDHVTMGMDKEVGEALTELRRSGREENAVTLCSRTAPRLGRHALGSLEPPFRDTLRPARLDGRRVRILIEEELHE